MRPRRAENIGGTVTLTVFHLGVSLTSACSRHCRSPAQSPADARSRCSYGIAVVVDDVDTMARVADPSRPEHGAVSKVTRPGESYTSKAHLGGCMPLASHSQGSSGLRRD